MGKKKNNRAKRSLSKLPKGLVQKQGGGPSSFADINPFEVTARQKKPKHEVLNRPVAKAKTTKNTLESLQRRQTQLRSTLKSSKKANVFVDRRIGQYDPNMSKEDQMLARLVKERSRQSQRISKFRLDDDGDDDVGGGDFFLTHKGKRLDPNQSEAIYSDDDDDDNGNLAAVDTELHFGGGGINKNNVDPYGGSSAADLQQVYAHRKTELDDLIARRKMMKAEKMQTKEAQVETVEQMDETFGDLSGLLRFRKNEKPPLEKPKPTQEDQEMNEWNKDLKELMMKPKRKATDRTKTPEEIAKEEAERLHELETRRLARMNGDFEEDDFSDIEVDSRKKKKKDKRKRNDEDLSESDDEDEEKVTPRFTADGLVYLDKEGNIVKKAGEEGQDDVGDENSSSSDDGNDDGDENEVRIPLAVGQKVRGNYRAAEQYDGHESWYDGVISKVHRFPDGSIKYDVEYNDGDSEENMIPANVKPIEDPTELAEKNAVERENQEMLKLKRKIAKDKARSEMPYVFEVPTTLEALHELIGKYASTGEDASEIIRRIHKANSVRLDRRNIEKMQNFYDVLLRRFIAVGDAIFTSGDGGKDLGRFKQLDALTIVMYKMAQDHPESAGAVWSRRIGILQNAHAKRLRDAEIMPEDFETAWPSTGTIFLLRALAHIFPVTDRRHYVVSPAILLLGQIVAHTPILSLSDLVAGILCSGLLIEYTKDAKRVPTESIGFLSGVVRLYAPAPGYFSVPCLGAANNIPEIRKLRQEAAKLSIDEIPSLPLEKEEIEKTGGYAPLAILSTALTMIQRTVASLSGSFSVPAEAELFSDICESLLAINPKLSKLKLPEALQQQIAATAESISNVCPDHRSPISRKGSSEAKNKLIKSLVPRMQDPEKYSMSKDKGKKSTQAAIDRTRREYKREHKAISRELRLDAAFIESERRKQQDKADNKAREKRQKNFAWLEGEQASMNQQVRQGGGLLKGGGMGLAKAKVATGKMGIKKGGKF